MNSRSLAVLILLAPACSSSTYEGSPASEAGAPDASVDDSAVPIVDGSGTIDASDGPRATACTAPPFFDFTAHVKETDGPQIPNATVSFSTCPGFNLTTDADGAASTQVTQGVPYSPIYYANGHIGVIGAESPGASDTSVSVALPRSTQTDVIPGYDKGKPFIQITLLASGAAPCDKVDGVTLAVTGHPEAVVQYMSATWPSDKAPASTTASVGNTAFVTGLTGGIVEVTGTKTGCTVSSKSSTQTGRFSLANSDVTAGNVLITN